MLGLALKAVDCLGERLKAGTVDSTAAVLADPIGPIVKLVQRLVDSLQRELNTAPETNVDSLLEGLGSVVGHMIAIANAFVLVVLELHKLFLQLFLLFA
jgi:hypothetical protein